MISASEMFLQDRETDAIVGNNIIKRNVMLQREYNNDRIPTKRYTDANEEMDCMREQEDARSNQMEGLL